MALANAISLSLPLQPVKIPIVRWYISKNITKCLWLGAQVIYNISQPSVSNQRLKKASVVILVDNHAQNMQKNGG